MNLDNIFSNKKFLNIYFKIQCVLGILNFLLIGLTIFGGLIGIVLGAASLKSGNINFAFGILFFIVMIFEIYFIINLSALYATYKLRKNEPITKSQMIIEKIFIITTLIIYCCIILPFCFG